MKLAAAALTTVLLHANVVDVRDGSIARDVAVTITGNRIVAVASSTVAPANANLVDATGKYVIPGLWDMHVHWFDERYLPLFIANGVTGVRQMWGFELHQKWRERIASGELVGPRQVIASPIIDGPQPIWPGSVAVKDAAEARAAVAAAKAAGFDFIKVYSLLPRDAFLAIAEEASKTHLPFAGHVPFTVRASEAAAAGIQSIEHLTGVLLECSSHEDAIRQAQLAAKTNPELFRIGRATAKELLDTYDERKAAALFARLVQNRTWQCPTLTVNRSTAHLADADFVKDDRLRYMPEEMRQGWDPRNDFRFRDLKPEDFATRKLTYAKQLQIVGVMNRAGVRFVAGTDVGNPYCFPGFSLHDELALLVEAGLSPLQALQAATANAAELTGSSELGAVAAGKLADLVVLDANPLKDIHNTTKIAAVVFDGRYYPREALAQMLAAAEKLASRKSLVEPLLAVLTAKDAAAAIAEYRRLKASEPAVWNFDESALNALGYRLLAMKRPLDAVAILALNVELFPDSGDVYDSLGEAYMAAGRKELAIANYRRSLELNPQNFNAVAKLKELEKP